MSTGALARSAISRDTVVACIAEITAQHASSRLTLVLTQATVTDCFRMVGFITEPLVGSAGASVVALTISPDAAASFTPRRDLSKTAHLVN
jgi:hypothetical protein